MTGTAGNTQTTTSPHATREGWLLLASDLLAQELFAPRGYRVPRVKVSVGYASTGLRSSAIGQCWSRKAECEACGYKVTVPRRFLHLGPPICPMHETPMREPGDWG